MLVGNSFNLVVSNTGTDSSSGSGSNQVGFVGDNQIELDNTLTAGNNLSINVSNTGNNSGTSPNGSTAMVDGSMLAVSNIFHCVDSLTINATNTGTNNCTSMSGGGGNQVAFIANDLIEFDNNFIANNNASIATTNIGTCGGSYTNSGNSVGYVTSFHIGAGNIQAGDHFTLTMENSGSDTSSGVGGNNVGYCSNSQFQLSGMNLGNDASMTITNSGVYSGSNSMSGNFVGYIGNPQISAGDFLALDSFTLVISNEGNDSSSGMAGSNNVGHIDDPQSEFNSFSVGNNANIQITNSGINTSSASSGTTGFVYGEQFIVYGSFTAGQNLTLTASNSATNTSSSTNVGSVQGSQISFQDTCTLGDGAQITASNTGSGNIQGNQIYFAQGFTLTGKATMTAINAGTVSPPSIHFSGNSSGGNATIVLQNASLLVDASVPSFTIGALNGDSTSIAQSIPQLEINLDSGTSASFAGSIQDVMGPSTLMINGNGTQILSGANTFTGLTTVQGGTLILTSTGSLTGNVQVNPLGTFGGNGTAPNVTNTGTIAPGASIGTLHFTTFTNNGGTYDVEVNGAHQSDLIDVTGTAMLTGGVVEVSSVDGTYNFQTPYTIIEAGTLNGQFSNVTAISPSINPVLSYDSQHVYLTLLTNFGNVANTHNQRNVSAGLDSIMNPNPLQQTLMSEIASLSADEAASALDSLSGWQYTTSLWLAQTVNGEFTKRLYDALRFTLTPNEQCKCFDGLMVWMEGGGTFKALDGNQNAHGLKATGGEVTLGFQKSFGCDWTIGLSGSYEHDHIHYKHHGGSGYSNTWLGGLYGLYSPQYFYLLGDFVYGYSSNQMKRTLNVGSLKFYAHSRPKISEFSFYGEVGGNWTVNVCSFQPFLGVTAGGNWCHRVTEKNGGGWALKIDKKDCSLVNTRLGLHFTAQPSSVYISADIAWDKRFTGTNTPIGGQFIEFGNDFVIDGVNLNSNSFDYALTIGKTMDCTRFYVQVSGEYWNHANVVDLLGGFQYSW